MIDYSTLPYVYKSVVVRGDGEFISSTARGNIALVYKIGLQTIPFPGTPIFTFPTLQRALDYSGLEAVLKCRFGQSLDMGNDMLSMGTVDRVGQYGMSAEELASFWDIITMKRPPSDEEFTNSWRIVPMLSSVVLVDWVVPVEIMRPYRLEL